MSSSDGQILIGIGANTAEYEKEVSNLTSKTDGILSRVGKVGKAAGLAIGTAAVAGTTAVAALAKQSLKAYASYEQLKGGVETLFGAGGKSLEEYAASVGKSVDEAEAEFNRLESAQEEVLMNADNAYMTAGLSANAYMEQATSTAAALVNSLGGNTEEAARLADQAIIDMSDNANKMGTDMERITDAYNGFAKGNFTMLDNLKLGYGGTKTEMERLLADAEKLSGIHYDIDSYADIVSAIHVIQEEMGIAGTTWEEATQTIEGSLKMTKAAWENWVAALGNDNADMEAMTQQLVESVGYALENIIPRIAMIATQIASGLPALISQLTSLLVTLIPQILPDLISAISGMVVSLAAAIPALIPVLLDAALQLFLSIMDALIQAVPQIVGQLPAMIDQIVNALVDALPLLLDAGLTLFLALTLAIIEAMPQIISTLIGALPNIINTLINFMPQLLAAAIQLFMALVRAIPQVVGSLLGAVGNMLGRIPGKAQEFMGQIGEIGKNIVQGIVNGIMSAPQAIADAIGNMIGNAMDFAKNLLGIASPSKVFKYYGQMIDEGLGVGIDKYKDVAVAAIGRLSDDVTGAAEFGALDVPLNFASGTLSAISAHGVRVDAALDRYSARSLSAETTQGAGITKLSDDIRDMGRKIIEAYKEPVDIRFNRRELGYVMRSAM